MAEPSLPEESIFAQALEIESAAERAAFLDRACDDNAALRAGVEALLRASQKSGDLLDLPEHPTQTADLPAAERPGTVIGPYKLIETVGEGGMGTVYMAQQTEPVKRLVALKLIKPGMDSRQVIARFEAERQALALMDHPNIARVFDGGTTKGEPGGVSPGRPYFVMELVKGVPLTRYCDEHRLTPRQRLELFVPICQAIQHAHHKGIIHRDIKPSNVLVALYDGRPVPKVIDFGVAKATGQQLTEQTLVTGFGAVVGTLEYMSPEQAELNQLDIDTRSDIYSLGVLLYELLTGTTPLQKKRLKEAALMEVLRLIREEEPPRPSTRLSTTDELPTVAANRGLEPKKLSGLVRGELDWIVMKALDKDRNRRYETANGFAMDIQRYLTDEPVLACPPSAWYRLRKFARRNRTTLFVVGLVLLCITLVGGVGGWVASDRAARQREADARAVEAITAGESRLRDGPSWDPALLAVAQRVEAELEAGALSPEVRRRAEQLRRDLRMLAELDQIRLREAESKDGEIFDAAGSEMRYRQAFSAYGLDVAALEPSEAAARVRGSAIREALIAGLDAWIQLKRERWRVPGDVGRLIAGLDAWKQLKHQDDKEQPRLRAILVGADDNAWRRTFREAIWANDAGQLKALAAEARDQRPSVLVSLAGQLNSAGAAEEARTLLRQAQQRHPGDFWINYHLARFLIFRPNLTRSDEAVGYLRAAVAIRPTSAEARNLLGASLHLTGDIDGAIRAYEQVIELDPTFILGHSNLVAPLLERRDFRRAIAECTEVIRLKPDSVGTWRQRAAAYRELQQWDKALADCRQTIDLYAGLVAEETTSSFYRRELALSYGQLATLLNESKQPDEAVKALSKAVSLFGELGAGREIGQLYIQFHEWEKAAAAYTKVIASLEKLAPDFRAKPEFQAAMKEYRKAIAGWEKLPADFRAKDESHVHMAWIFHNLTEALEACKEVHFRDLPEFRINMAWSHNHLAAVLIAAKQFDEAEEAYRAAVTLWTKLAADFNQEDYRQNLAYNSDLLGHLLNGRGKFSQAAEAFRQAMTSWHKLHTDFGKDDHRRFSSSSQAWMFEALGAHAQETKQPQEAEQAYRKAVAIHEKLVTERRNPTYAERLRVCYDRLVSLLKANGKAEDAAKACRQAIAFYEKQVTAEPDKLEYRREIGQLYIQFGEWEKAAAAYTKVIELKPGDWDAWFQRGQMYSKLQQWDKAIADYSQTIKLDAKRWDFWSERGFAQLALHQWDKSIEDYTKAIELAPDVHTNWHHRGLAYGELGQWDKVVHDRNELLKRYPNDSNAFHFRAVAYVKLKQPEKAVADLRQAFARGYKDLEGVKSDERFAPLRSREDFKKLLAELEAKKKK